MLSTIYVMVKVSEFKSEVHYLKYRHTLAVRLRGTGSMYDVAIFNGKLENLKNPLKPLLEKHSAFVSRHAKHSITYSDC